VSPTNDAPGNAGVVESGTLAGKLAVGGLTLTDDSASCDHDGYLDPGEKGNLKLIVANDGILAAEDVTITATTSAPGIVIGPAVRMSLLQPFSQSSIAIPVKVLPSAPKNTNVTINVVVKGEYTCDDNGVTVALTVRTGADEVQDSSTTDHVETAVTPWTATGDGAAELWGRAYDADGNQAFLGADAGYPSDTQFVSPALQVSATDAFVVAIDHAYALEATYDGGVIELSTDGTTWQDVTAYGVTPGYGQPLQFGGDNPLEGRAAFTGTSPGYPARSTLTMNFGTQFAGQTVRLRFRIGSDIFIGATGWNIDNIAVSGITNKPFPVLAAETGTCSHPTPRTVDSGVLSTVRAPDVSLASFDAGVCISTDL
jgi:hypothetical protein